MAGYFTIKLFQKLRVISVSKRCGMYFSRLGGRKMQYFRGFLQIQFFFWGGWTCVVETVREDEREIGRLLVDDVASISTGWQNPVRPWAWEWEWCVTHVAIDRYGQGATAAPLSPFHYGDDNATIYPPPIYVNKAANCDKMDVVRNFFSIGCSRFRCNIFNFQTLYVRNFRKSKREECIFPSRMFFVSRVFLPFRFKARRCVGAKIATNRQIERVYCSCLSVSTTYGETLNI
jgi:hypothetical protein